MFLHSLKSIKSSCSICRIAFLSPLRAFIERGEHLVEGARAHVQHGATASRGLADVGEGCHRIGNHHGVGVTEQVLEKVDKPVLLDKLGINSIAISNQEFSFCQNILKENLFAHNIGTKCDRAFEFLS